MTLKDDPDAPPSEEEIRESERLREALEDPSKESAEADLLRAVKNAAAPKALAKDDLEAAVDRGLARERSSGVVIRVAFGAGLIVAAAAAIVFFVGRGPVATPELARARSTQELFTERFEARGGESARIDRIAIARAADLRDNRFARWGVSTNRGRR
jgi:hypothetical protein